jgi:hypothetical protein
MLGTYYLVMKTCIAIGLLVIISSCGNGKNYADKIKEDSTAISKVPVDTIKTDTASSTNGSDNAPVRQMDTGKGKYPDSAY